MNVIVTLRPLVAVWLLFAAACSSPQPAGIPSTMTLAEAAHRVEGYARQALSALGSNLTAITLHKDYDFPCSKADGSPSQDRRDARIDYQLGKAASEQTPVLFDRIRAYWVTTGFTVTTTTRSSGSWERRTTSTVS